MVRAAGQTKKDQAEHALQIVIDLLEAQDDETVQIDGVVPPGFEELCLKEVKSAWFADVAPTDRRDPAMWPALWRTNTRAIMHKFMYKAL